MNKDSFHGCFSAKKLYVEIRWLLRGLKKNILLANDNSKFYHVANAKHL